MATITGTSGDDRLVGTDQPDYILGLAGDDVLDGGLGYDTLQGQDGDDVLIGDGADSFYGGPGSDRFIIAGANPGVGGLQSRISDFASGSDLIDISRLVGTQALLLDNLENSSSNYLRVVLDGYVLSTEVRQEDSNPPPPRLTLKISDLFVGMSTPFVLRGAVTQVGGDAGDRLYGTSANNVLDGAGGSDVIFGGLGADVLTGGAGADFFLWTDFSQSADQAPDRITDFETGSDMIDLRPLSITSYDISVANGVYVVTATGAAGSLRILSDRIVQLGDILVSGQGRPVVGTAASERLEGGDGADQIDGADGDDIIRGGFGGDLLTGGAGADLFQVRSLESIAGARDEITDFQTGVDRLDIRPMTLGYAAIETRLTTSIVRVDDDRYVIYSSASGLGATSADVQATLIVRGSLQGGDLILDAGDGIDFLGLDDLNDRLIGTATNDRLYGFAGDDRLEGGSGDDRLFGDQGADILIGGAGADRFSYRSYRDSNVITGFDTIVDFEQGVDLLDFLPLATIYPPAINRSLLTLLRLDRDATGTTITAETREGNLVLRVDAQLDARDLVPLIVHAPVSISGSAASETLQGGNQRTTIYGNGGDDRIVAGSVSYLSELFGGEGDDVLIGGSTMYGGVGNDRLEAGVFNSAVPTSYLYGGEGADVLVGGPRADQFSYSSPLDSGPGAGGFDTILNFELDRDKIDLRFLNGVTAISVARSVNGTSLVFASTPTGQLQVGVGVLLNATDIVLSVADFVTVDVLGTAANETLRGGNEANRLFGLGGGDALLGGGGDDILVGDGGADSLTGGTGADRFAYRSAADSNAQTGYDTIQDFVSGQDKIDFFLLDGTTTIALARQNGATLIYANTPNGQVVVGVNATVQGGDVLAPATNLGLGLDIVGEARAETIIGSGNADRLFGLLGDDVIVGGGGDDLIYGDLGRDLLTGGAGGPVRLSEQRRQPDHGHGRDHRLPGRGG